MAKAVSDGDLTKRTIRYTNQDEIGDLIYAVNAMMDSLRRLINKISEASQQVTAAAEELTASAEQSTKAAEQTAIAIADVARETEHQMTVVSNSTQEIEDMSASFKHIATNADIVSEKTGKTAEAAEQGGAAINKAVAQMATVETAVMNSVALVSKLGERSKEIDQIVGTISGIAGQTNLLALNAAIEAARAGEQGRGFAVVAEEVRKLAEQSQDAAKQIAQLISEVQTDTEQAVAAMNNGAREVGVGTQVVNSAGDAFQKISGLIAENVAQIYEISEAIKSLAAGSNRIVASIQEIAGLSREASGQAQTVAAVTEEQTAAMEEIAASSQALAKMAEDLQSALQQFKI